MKNEAAWAWLNGRAKFNIRPGLDRIQALLDLLGHPEQMTPMIHIAGTNGKGSTIAFAREILQAQGLTVGTFTSPAIEKFTEQIAINGTAIPDDLLINYLERLRPLVEMLDHDELTAGATVFELTTAIAFLYFAESKFIGGDCSAQGGDNQARCTSCNWPN
jgi:dihydrofolate synthase / folylpolyglutamate synthase